MRRDQQIVKEEITESQEGRVEADRAVRIYSGVVNAGQHWRFKSPPLPRHANGKVLVMNKPRINTSR